MNDGREQVKTARTGEGSPTADLDEAAIQSLLDSRRAALNLMEDAVEAREQAERAVAALRESEGRHTFMLMLSDSLRPLGDPVEVQRVASQVLGKYLGAGRVMYAEVEPDSDTAIVYQDYHDGVGSFSGTYLLSDLGEKVAAEMRRGRTIAITDIATDERLSEKARSIAEATSVAAFIGVPIVKNDNLVGLFAVHLTEARRWTSGEVLLIEEVAQRTWASVARARAEATTREIEKRYLTLLNSIDEGFCTIEVKFDESSGEAIDYRFLEVSPSFERQAGIADATGRWMSSIAPGHERVWYETYGRIAKTGIPERFEDWSTPLARWWSVYAFRVDDPSLHRVAVLFFDITERKRADEALMESQARLQTAQEAGNIGIWDWQAKDGKTYWSETLWAMYGYDKPLETSDNLWETHLHPDDAAQMTERVQTRMASNETRYRDEFRIIRAGDDAVRWIESVAVITRDAKGRPLQMAGVNLDITERRRSEEALRESEERLRLLTESFQDIAIFTSDTKGRVVTWNPGSEKIFGYTDGEIIGKNASILFVPEDRENRIPEREMETARATGRASDERWHLRKDYSRFYASGVTAPLFDDGVLIGYAKIARDLTEQKKTEEELRQHRERLELLVVGRTAELAEANETLRSQMHDRRRIEEERILLLQKIVTTQEEERRRIARDMHDSLGQQLTALRLKLASMKTDDNGRMSESLEILQELGKRIDAEVNFLVWELRPTILDDLGLVAAIDNYVREWSRHYGIPAEFHAGRLGSERLGENVETNLYRITQEALNNTYKHSGAKNATVVLEGHKGELVLVIEDDGKGFALDGPRVPRSGRGLGLIGMRERAAIIGGTIEIESAPGKGTTVFVRAPM